MHLESKIDKIDYEDKYTELRERLEEMKTRRVDLDTIQDEEKTIVSRINAFRKIFESGHDQENKPEPYMVTFIFKTGLTSKVQGEKVPRKKKGKSADKECSHQAGQPRGVHRVDMSVRYLEILDFLPFIDVNP